MLIESLGSSGRIRVVFDANVLISAALAGVQAEYAMYLVADGRMIGFASEPILSDVERKLVEKFHRPGVESASQVASYREILELVVPADVSAPKLRDPRDLHVLGTAVAAKANLIVTSDQDLLTLKRYKKIGIVHPKTLRWTFPK